MQNATIRERKKQLNKAKFQSEMWFWKLLKEHHISGYSRNVCIGKRFFGDFVFKKKKIIIEVDGNSHAFTKVYDLNRDFFLKDLGYKVIRVKYGDLINARKILGFLAACGFVRVSQILKEKEKKNKLNDFNSAVESMRKLNILRNKK